MCIINARIDKTEISVQRGILTGWLYLTHEKGNQGFGGYELTTDFILNVLKVTESTSWENLPGRIIRIDQSSVKIKGIGNYLKNEWFYPGSESAPTGTVSDDGQ